MNDNQQEMVTMIENAVRGLTCDNIFRIKEIMYGTGQERIVDVTLTSNTVIKNILFTRGDGKRCILEIDDKPAVRFNLDFILIFLGLDKSPVEDDFVKWLAIISGIIRLNFTRICEIFHRKNRFNTMRQLKKIEEIYYREQPKAVRMQVIKNLAGLTSDGLFEMTELIYDEKSFGNIFVSLTSDNGIYINFIKDRGDFSCIFKFADYPEVSILLEDLLTLFNKKGHSEWPEDWNKELLKTVEIIRENWSQIVAALDSSNRSNTVSRLKPIVADRMKKRTTWPLFINLIDTE
jgi:hypothetical protein